MQFTVHSARNQADLIEVRYECECGCKPRARYHRGTDEAGHEHCCCGRVHFVGARAGERLRDYLAERRAQGEDTDMVYTCYTSKVEASWGESVSVAYALPDNPRQH